MNKLFVVCLMLVVQVSYAQSIDQTTRFDHARLLYEKGAYLAARQEFSTINDPNLFQNAQYYIASSAVRSGQIDGEYLVDQFVKNYPNSQYSTKVYFDLANFFYVSAKYDKAIKYFNRSISNDPSELNYKKGYSYFQIDEPQEAMRALSNVNSSSEYYADAGYFKGYIYYSEEKFDKAYPQLKIAFDSKMYRGDALVLYTSSLYQAGEYKEVVNLLEGLDESVDQPEVLNYLADSYYAVGDFRSAKDTYSKLFKNSNYRTEQNYFKAGFCSYKIDNRDQAIDWLKRSAVSDDTVGAYASYYLGVIYHEQGNLPFASTSFGNTAKYNTRLKEEATYLYGKTYLEIPKYEDAIKVLTNYVNEYPQGIYADISSEMIASAYEHTSNYDLAMKYIEDLDVLTSASKRIYQRITFTKATSLFNAKKFAQASETFQKSLIHNIDKELTQQTYYWMAETKTLEGNYKESLFYYNSVNKLNYNLYVKAQYGLGYAYFNLQDYEAAINPFQTVITHFDESLNKRYKQDTYIRLADCYFALKNYDQSLDNYFQALKHGAKKRDEIYFQIGLVYRYKNRYSDAKKYFQKLIKEVPKSSQIDHAQFQIAQIDFEQGNESNAIDSYRTLMINHPSSAFIPYALVSQAVAYENIGESQAGITNYKEVLERFPRHEMSNSALLALQEQNNQGNFDSFDTYLAMYKKAHPNSEALENIEFETAKSKFYSQDYKGVITSLNAFLENYPNSALKTEAIYFTGDSHYRLNQKEKAKSSFKEISNDIDFSKHIKVLYRLAEIEGEQENYESSNDFYYQMSTSSPSSRNIIFLNRGLMENYYSLGEYDSAKFYARKLLNNSRISVAIESLANLTMGKSYFKQSNYDEALTYLIPLVSNAPDETGAEAYYVISQLYFAQGKDDKALESLFVLTNNFKNYDYWQGKAYLLMSDIYLDTDEVFQAKATLNSIIENSNIVEVVEEAKEKLKNID
ncbi:tetratricopeptide repeat protein [Reichenbachiella versicolor]|uniref:tetratricopeptide repeat protein n=1 Tax=Reichenbachiella versicolor TaxID=1821036 RepID=UPI0013A54F8A|nr:tetratricopeptide repeat protein [Reichenbachiella versicolor]